MKKITLFFISCIFVFSVAAQNCTAPMPNVTYKVKKTDGMHAGSGDILWVCGGVTMDVTGGSNTVYAEENSNITLTGDGNTLHIKKGAVVIDGDMNIIQHQGPSVTVTDNGMGTTQPNMCDTLFFDYTNAPDLPQGCPEKFVGIDNITTSLSRDINIYPNPVAEVLTVDVPANLEVNSYRLFDITGKLMMEKFVNRRVETIDLSEVKSGLYFIQFQTNNGVKSQRIAVE